jgi:hypothetical protein
MIRLDREDYGTFLMVKNPFNGSWKGIGMADTDKLEEVQ